MFAFSFVVCFFFPGPQSFHEYNRRRGKINILERSIYSIYWVDRHVCVQGRLPDRSYFVVVRQINWCSGGLDTGPPTHHYSHGISQQDDATRIQYAAQPNRNKEKWRGRQPGHVPWRECQPWPTNLFDTSFQSAAHVTQARLLQLAPLSLLLFSIFWG
jgi:hypothetical protein